MGAGGLHSRSGVLDRFRNALMVRLAVPFAGVCAGLGAFPPHAGAQEATSATDGLNGSLSIVPESGPDVIALFFSLLSEQISLADILVLSISIGAIVFGATSAIAFLRLRRRTALDQDAYKQELDALGTRADRAEALLGAENTIIVHWDPNGRLEILGHNAVLANSPRERTTLLDFTHWLDDGPAQTLRGHIDRLRAQGEAFNVIVPHRSGQMIAVDGRAIDRRSVVRLTTIAGDAAEQARLRSEHARSAALVAAHRALLDALPVPAWVRTGKDDEASVVWGNAAYRKMASPGEPARAGEALPSLAQLVAVDTAQNGTARMRHVEVDAPSGRLGCAVPSTVPPDPVVQQAAALNENLGLLEEVHTSIAIFNENKRLVYANRAFNDLWGLEPRWTMPGVEHGRFLDTLREAQKVPLEADYKSWRAKQLSAYDTPEGRRDTWHLPDGQMLSVVSHQRKGQGLALIVEDETELMALESRYKQLERVQQETLDNNLPRCGQAGFGMQSQTDDPDKNQPEHSDRMHRDVAFAGLFDDADKQAGRETEQPRSHWQPHPGIFKTETRVVENAADERCQDEDGDNQQIGAGFAVGHLNPAVVQELECAAVCWRFNPGGADAEDANQDEEHRAYHGRRPD